MPKPQIVKIQYVGSFYYKEVPSHMVLAHVLVSVHTYELLINQTFNCYSTNVVFFFINMFINISNLNPRVLDFIMLR